MFVENEMLAPGMSSCYIYTKLLAMAAVRSADGTKSLVQAPLPLWV